MKKTLLQIAKNVKVQTRRHKHVSSEVMTVALAWLKDEVSWKQVSYAFYGRAAGAEAYGLLASGLREAYRRGKLKIK